MDASDMPIMGTCCKTCPFKLEDGVVRNPRLVQTVISRNLFQSQQICHHPRLIDKPETHRCRGYFDYAFKVYTDLGMSPEKYLKNSDNPLENK